MAISLPFYEELQKSEAEMSQIWVAGPKDVLTLMLVLGLSGASRDSEVNIGRSTIFYLLIQEGVYLQAPLP